MADDSGAPKHPQQLFFDNVSPATRLLEKRRQMYEVQDALDNQKARFAKEEETFRKREEVLRAKDLQLQHQLFRFNKFLQDNEAKRRRADTRAAEEMAQIKQKDEEIRDLEKQLMESKHQCADLEEEVARNMKYEEFLERVKDTCDEYSEIQDLVTRYETLESANRELMKDQTRSETRAEELRNEFQNYRKEQEMKTLALTNRMAALSSDLEEVRKMRHELEVKVDEARQEDSKHSLYFGQILMSVENLFLRCTTTRKGIKHADPTTGDEGTKGREGEDGEAEGEESFRKKKENAIRELDVILNYLKDFKDITEVLKKQNKSDNAKQRAVGQLGVDASKVPDLVPRFETAEPLRADRGSTNSGSQGNTRELSKNIGPAAGPSVASAAADS